MIAIFRICFLTVYVTRLAVFLVRVLPAGLRTPARGGGAEGSARWLPAVVIPVGLLMPPLLILLRAGELPRLSIAWRWLGVLASVAGVVLMLWATRALGRFFVPQARVVPGQVLVTSGPYRLVRHPAYSGDLLLWAGAALATANAWLMALWPLALLGNHLSAREEDRVLERVFGDAARAYVARTGELCPKIARW